LEGEQLPEQFADADAGKEIAPPTGIVFICFVISINWTIQSQLHEPRKRQNAAPGNFAPDKFN
jgi:hypothetical protein